MATIQQRTNKDGAVAYRAIVRRKGFTGSASFDTERAAAAWADAMEERAAKGKANDEDAAADITLATPVRVMLQKYLREIVPKHRGAAQEVVMLNMLMSRYAAFDKPICDFDCRDVQRIVDHRLKGDKARKFEPVGAGTIHRNIAMLSGAFSHCMKKWVKLNENPVKNTDRPKLPAHRTRRVDASEANKICEAADYVQGTKPTTRRQYVVWAFLFARETAMRRGEVLMLTRSTVFLEKKFVHLETTKNGEARDVPLNAKARALLALLDLDSLAPNAPIVPVRVSTFSALWNLIRHASGVENVRFHDSRHEATTQLAKVFKNPVELAKITGHKDLRMLSIYVNPTATELADMMDAA